ncbi:CHS1 [Mytilus coruscus]|uniref:chitin synthase n=1 Tax=Mytilus coruscus TaxID=42192 RepID=A0A6J8DB37_MYTCO|nr:CHS1 [Mytilus coruscus]
MAEKPEGSTKTSRIVNPEVIGQYTNETEEIEEIPKEYDIKLKIKPEKILKIAFSIFLCIVAFGSGLVGRITLHILLWHINPPIETPISVINTLGGLLEPNCSICMNETSCTSNTRSTAVDESWIWALFLVIIAPYCLTFMSTFFRICFKSNKRLNRKVLFAVIIIETLHSVGLSILGFLVLPAFDPASASVVYLATGVVPPILDLCDKISNAIGMKFPDTSNNQQSTNDKNKTNEQKSDGNSQDKSPDNTVGSPFKFPLCNETSKLSFSLPFAGLALQIAGVILITIYINIGSMMAFFVLSVVLVSVKYWENFITMGTEKSILFRKLKRELHIRRTKTSCIVSLWKMLITFLAVITIFTSRGTDSMLAFRALFNKGIASIKTVFGEQNMGFNPICQTDVPFLAALICIICDYLCYKTSKTVCVINCQRFGFSLPMAAIPPVVTIVIGGLMNHPDILKLDSCDLLFSDWCIKDNSRLSEKCTELIIAFVLLYISFLIITRHIWKSNGRKNGETARILISPFYCGLLTDLSLILNRRRDDDEYDIVHREKKPDKETKKMKTLYACCATMWHENAIEMKQLVTSLLRLDMRQAKNKFLKEEFEEDVETFDLEAHVFFDDAFLPTKGKDGNKKVMNTYVQTFIQELNDATREFYEKQIDLQEGGMLRTPYGSRIEWTLPGENKLFVHLKDNTKIRNKKRWSQVMYMLFILKWKIKSRFKSKGLEKKEKKKAIQEAAENTFLLALDGDVDFQPEAVLSLMRRMEKNDKVGAACGRIHPIGNGPMVWYQQFEYAISHWLQKATEHVIGCVLCSPGCFSLFRGSAILQHEVLETYTSVAQEARHCLQYDQGEDRWLCTLLLQKGWKIEYCAESDSYTFAPESFYEFYNQRRRWTPSTMANILEIIQDWRNVTKNNENISFLYIVYQVFLFVSTVLTPGTIFMIILGALIVGFDSIPPWLALILNLIPVVAFILMCLYTSTERQEILCLLPGILYFLAIPSMSMLMFLYSIGNLHVTSWGTRDTNTKKESDNKSKTEKINDKEATEYLCSIGKFVCCAMSTSKDHTTDKCSNKDQDHKVEANNEKSTINDERQEKIDVEDDESQDKDMTRFTVDESVPNISKKEIKFWEKKIESYLKPHDKMDLFTIAREKKLKNELVELRNSVCLFVYLLNAILVTVMFGLTQVNAFKNSLTAGFDCGGENISIVPIAILFSAVFGILLLIQFLCMLYHRFSTLVHITANTDLRNTEDEYSTEILKKIVADAVERNRDQSEDGTDTDMNRSVIKAKEKHYQNFKDLMMKNQPKLRSMIKGSLYLKNLSLQKKVTEKWQSFLKKQNKPEPKLLNVVEKVKKSKICPAPTNDSQASGPNTDSNV